MTHKLSYPPKDPAAKLDYEMDWSDYLAGVKTIASATVTSASLTIEASSASTTGVTWRASGGTAGTVAEVEVHVVLDTGEEDTRRAEIQVVER